MLGPPLYDFRLSFFGLPGSSVSEDSTCHAGDPGLIPGLGRSPGEWNGYPLPYSSLEDYMDRGAWQAALHGVQNNECQVHFLLPW